MTIRIADIGRNFGMACMPVFRPWNAEEVRINKLNDAEPLIESVDLVCFGGGGDIHPSTYGHRNTHSSVGPVASYRDNYERVIWDLAIKHKKPIFGICRGAQLACALSGGWLIQDVGGHSVGGAGHELTTIDGTKVYMTSLHHQLMHPWDIEHKLIAWTPFRSGRFGYDEDTARISKDYTVDPEVVYFPKTNSLGIQGHPEFYDDPMSPPVVYARDLVKQYLNVGV